MEPLVGGNSAKANASCYHPLSQTACPPGGWAFPTLQAERPQEKLNLGAA